MAERQRTINQIPLALMEELQPIIDSIFSGEYPATEENPLLALAEKYGVPTLTSAVQKARSKHVTGFVTGFAGPSDEQVNTYNQAIISIHRLEQELKSATKYT